MSRCKQNNWSGIMAGMAIFAAVGASAHAAYSFNETFSPPAATGVTAGTPDPINGYDWENGWLNGDHPDAGSPGGWTLIEAPTSGSSLGQRPVSFWPGGTDTEVANVRGRGNAATAFAIRDLATGLTSGNVTLVTAAYTVIGDISQSIRLASAGGAANALQLNFGTPQLGTSVNDYLRVNQVGEGNVVVADENTLTTGGAPLRWNVNSFSSSSGDYAIISIDFDAIAHTGVVNITTVDALGVQRSIAPVNVSLDPSVTAIERISMSTNTTGGNGSLVYYSNFSINGETVPEPSGFALIGLSAAALWRRRR